MSQGLHLINQIFATLDGVRRSIKYELMPMKRLCFVLMTLLMILSGCGDGYGPDKGLAGNVLVVDLPTQQYESAQMRIGFNSAEQFQKMQNLAGSKNEAYIFGLVVPDTSYPLGFYLDPSTTSVPDGFVPELQKSMREVTENLEQWKGQKVYVALHVKIRKYL